MAKTDKDPKRLEQEQAWIGDSVLDLWARSWILKERGTLCGDTLRRMTCNQFLACFGNPTSVEAEIGRHYEEHGLVATHQWIEDKFLPRILQQEANVRRKAKK